MTPRLSGSPRAENSTGDPDPVRLERRELAGVHVDQGTEDRLDDFGPDSGLIAGRSGAVLWHGRRLRGVTPGVWPFRLVAG